MESKLETELALVVTAKEAENSKRELEESLSNMGEAIEEIKNG